MSRLHADESEYVRKSAGNALRDISRQHKELIRTELQNWDTSDKHVLQTYKLASKYLQCHSEGVALAPRPKSLALLV